MVMMMMMKKIFTFLAVILIMSTPSIQAASSSACMHDVSAVLDHFFQLFNVPCSKWVQLFYPGAVFSHPKAGRVEGHEALQSFCQGAQASAAPQMFRQDGDALVTATGSGANAQCSLLVPYVWVQAPASSTGEFMSNTGFESMVLIPTNTTEPRYAILSVTEFFSRSARPFVWPQS